MANQEFTCWCDGSACGHKTDVEFTVCSTCRSYGHSALPPLPFSLAEPPISDTGTLDKTQLVKLLNLLDGHLGLAIYRGEGKTERWKIEAQELIIEIRATIKKLEAEK